MPRFIPLVLMLAPACSASSSPAALQTAKAPLSGDHELLPQFHGTWRGQLENLPRPIPQPPTVFFTVGAGADAADGCLEWRMEYRLFGTSVGLKDYQLCRDDNGEFVIDEGGGLLLAATVVGDDIFTGFALPDHRIRIFTHMHRDGDRIFYDIFSTSGEGDATAGVVSFSKGSIQRVIFERTGE
jgi:hypothetical protein